MPHTSGPDPATFASGILAGMQRVDPAAYLRRPGGDSRLQCDCRDRANTRKKNGPDLHERVAACAESKTEKTGGRRF